MNDFQEKLERTWSVDSTTVTPHEYEYGIERGTVLSLEDEDEEFIKEFQRVISNKHIKDVDDTANE